MGRQILPTNLGQIAREIGYWEWVKATSSSADRQRRATRAIARLEQQRERILRGEIKFGAAS